ncbi:MAG: SDR family oxidoreductase [Acidimicrobiales bacterium]
MDLGLRDRVYIVTGASRGLGRATAKALAAEGCRLVLSARDETAIRLAAKAMGDESRVVAVAAENADPGTPDVLVQKARAAFGRLDGALLSTGGPAAGPASTYGDEDWRRAFESVFLGAVRAARVIGGALGHGGAVALVLSVSVKTPVDGLVASNALRPGLAMFTKTLADELGPAGVRVFALAPGWIDTDRTIELDRADPEGRSRKEAVIALRRYGTPEEFGRMAAFCLSPAASYMTGSVVMIDGGISRAL